MYIFSFYINYKTIKQTLCFTDQAKGCRDIRIDVQFMHNLINRNIHADILHFSIRCERIIRIY